MKKFKNHQRPRRKYKFNIVGHKKALKIWWDSPFKLPGLSAPKMKAVSLISKTGPEKQGHIDSGYNCTFFIQ